MIDIPKRNRQLQSASNYRSFATIRCQWRCHHFKAPAGHPENKKTHWMVFTAPSKNLGFRHPNYRVMAVLMKYCFNFVKKFSMAECHQLTSSRYTLTLVEEPLKNIRWAYRECVSNKKEKCYEKLGFVQTNLHSLQMENLALKAVLEKCELMEKTLIDVTPAFNLKLNEATIAGYDEIFFKYTFQVSEHLI